MLRIPALRDENGRDLLSDDTSSDKSSPKVETKWTTDAIRAFDRVWTAVPQNRQTLAPGTYPTPHGMITLKQSHQYWHTTEQPYQLPHDTISRFYSPDCLKEKSLGPENYKD
ncbi:unnamed protein product [Penicillium crustosum]